MSVLVRGATESKFWFGKEPSKCTVLTDRFQTFVEKFPENSRALCDQLPNRANGKRFSVWRRIVGGGLSSIRTGSDGSASRLNIQNNSLGDQQANRTPSVHRISAEDVLWSLWREIYVRSVVGSVSVLQHADLRTGVNATRGSGSLPSDFNGSNLNSMRCWIHKLKEDSTAGAEPLNDGLSSPIIMWRSAQTYAPYGFHPTVSQSDVFFLSLRPHTIKS